MIGVDTNVLARLFVDDGSPERLRAMEFFTNRGADELVFVSLVVLVEFVWLLSGRYEFTRTQILDALEALLKNAGFVLECEDLVIIALERARSDGSGIPDNLVARLGERAGCAATVTFDRTAAKRIPGMELLK